jgi:hypothetical protein
MVTRMAAKPSSSIVRRGASPAIAKAKHALERARGSLAYQRTKAVATRRRSVAMAFGAGALYEIASQKMPIPTLPMLPISAEGQHAIAMALIADNTKGIVQELAVAAADGLSFSAGRRMVNTKSVGADDGNIF